MMKPHLCLALLAVVLPAGDGWGAGVWIDSSRVTLSNTGATVINARLRASAGGSDQLMADGGGTNATSGTTLSHNMGNVGSVSSRDYAFTLEHRLGQGLIFQLVDNQTAPQSWVLAYGSGFSPALPTPGPRANVVSQSNLGGAPPGGLPVFNSLLLELQASEAHSGGVAELATLGGLYFSSPTLSLQDGAFDAVVVTPTTPGTTSGEVVGGVPVTALNGFAFQRLVADDSLTAHNWTLGGTVHLQRSGGGDGEGVRMLISGQQVTAVFPPIGPIPEPAAAGLLGLAGALGLRRRRGRTA
jgi:MYXO-CTERM domain-containing protein